MKNLILFIFAVFNFNVVAQTTIFSSGFETGNSTFNSYSATGTITQPSTATPRTGTRNGEIASPTSSTYAGSIITSSTLTFTEGKFYQIDVWARVTQWAGKLKIAKSTTSSNAAISGATGEDAMLNPATNNVSTTTYTKFTCTWRQTVTESKYVGFYMTTASSGTNKIGKLHIDDVTIIEQNYPIYPAVAFTTGVETISEIILKKGAETVISQTSLCTTDEVAQPSTHTKYTSSVMGTLYLDSTYNISIKGHTGGNFTSYNNVFIDYNRDGDFVDAGEQTQIGTLTNQVCVTAVSNNFTIPATSDTGLVVMRVMKRYSAYSTSTQNGAGYGEAEDYLIRIAVPPPTPLPVELLYFEGTTYPSFNNLKWTTASEQNSSHFVIKRSTDGENWDEIATKLAAGNSIEKINYYYLDNINEFILYYYRLVQYDIDGKFVVYGPIALDNTTKIKKVVKYVNLMGQEVGFDYKGIVFEVYEDGTSRKILR